MKRVIDTENRCKSLQSAAISGDILLPQKASAFSARALSLVERSAEIAVARSIAWIYEEEETLDLQILIVTESVVVQVRPVAVADDADLAVHKVLRVRGVEEQHRQGEDCSDDPYDDRDAQRRLFPHTRLQRVHNGHVAETKRAQSRTSKRRSRRNEKLRGWAMRREFLLKRS